MYLCDFQLVLRDHDPFLYGEARKTWQPIDIEIRRHIPTRYHFGGVSKIVLELGPERLSRPAYRVLLNVGLFHFPNFDVRDFITKDEPSRIESTLKIIEASMLELGANFNTPVGWLIDTLHRMRPKA